MEPVSELQIRNALSTDESLQNRDGARLTEINGTKTEYNCQCVCFVQYIGYTTSAVVPNTRPIPPRKPKTRRQKEQFS